jgi:serine/threonine protein kinase
MQNSWPSVPNYNDPRLVGRRYLLEHSLGEGGFAEVFYAYDTHFQPNRPVALKLLYPQLLTDPQVCRDLQNEASALAAFNHPHILKVLDFEFNPAQAYLVTELAEGGSLDELLRPAGKPGQFLTLSQALVYLEQLASALDEAHRAGVIHRDIKPKNILLDRQGRALLADFGLAMTITHSVALKTMQSVFGTPEYTAPEVWEDKVGKASDIYALGAVLFEMLAGQAPFQGSLPALLKQHLHDPVPRLGDRKPDLVYPAQLDEVLAQAMAKDPAQRPRSATELFRLARQVNQNATNPATFPPPRPYNRSVYSYPPQGFDPNFYRAKTVPTPAPNPAPQGDPAASPANRGAGLTQLPVGELLADLSAQLKSTDPVGRWRKATRLGGTLLEHTYRHKELYLKAFNDLKTSIKPGVNQAEMLLKRGQDYLNQRMPKQALFVFTDALQTSSPFKADLFYWRGVAHRALKDNQAAREDFKRAARLGHTAAKEALRDMTPSFFDILKGLFNYFRNNRHRRARTRRPSRP